MKVKPGMRFSISEIFLPGQFLCLQHRRLLPALSSKVQGPENRLSQPIHHGYGPLGWGLSLSMDSTELLPRRPGRITLHDLSARLAFTPRLLAWQPDSTRVRKHRTLPTLWIALWKSGNLFIPCLT